MDSPLDRVMRLLNGYRFSQAVSVATRLGIPDLLASGAKTPEELPSWYQRNPTRFTRHFARARVVASSLRMTGGVLRTPQCRNALGATRQDQGEIPPC
jgi:hypothetical protein